MRKARGKQSSCSRSCLDVAYGLLARREHSRKELHWKLQQRENCADTDIDALLDALEADNLLSDERYAEAVVHAGLQRGHGRLKIRNKLRETGVSGLLVERYLDQADINWYEQIHQVRLKKVGEHLPVEYAARAKLSRFLASRGFETELIREELDL